MRIAFTSKVNEKDRPVTEEYVKEYGLNVNYRGIGRSRRKGWDEMNRDGLFVETRTRAWRRGTKVLEIKNRGKDLESKEDAESLPLLWPPHRRLCEEGNGKRLKARVNTSFR
ncbi:hypothetical protein [Pedobacter sp. SYSU D00535]|uniref:hypothetical protein n=1 Tax=Pedobacter sp. SYSU D00535 TaxID=2810308 RepID=UPI001A963328|nr:hypothetical protein [Pedobacter sp. SYSU D00535]